MVKHGNTKQPDVSKSEIFQSSLGVSDLSVDFSKSQKQPLRNVKYNSKDIANNTGLKYKCYKKLDQIVYRGTSQIKFINAAAATKKKRRSPVAPNSTLIYR